MPIDLDFLYKKLADAATEDTVDPSDVDPYLLNEVLRPILAGVDLCYGDIDYSRFALDDIRELASFCQMREIVSNQLEETVRRIIEIQPTACSARSFC